MPTLIIAFTHRRLPQRCDQRCYTSVTNRCKCLCGGRNHGKGLATARANANSLLPQMESDWNDAHPDNPPAHFYATAASQPPNTPTFPAMQDNDT